MDDDDFGADADFLSALASSAPAANSQAQSRSQPSTRPQQPTPQRIQQPTPQRIQQPTPQRLDRAPPTNAASGAAKIVQPTPQALPQRGSGSSILVSPRQKGNPVLASLRSVAWEYSDIPADFGLGQTTCALFLSLKYHRLHPEYIYTRIRNLQGKYNLRIILTMVDIQNHEDSLRELSKTSLINNVTIILCWSAAEAARYLELYKSYEHANFGAIKGQQATSYAERLVEFVTVPRGINKADSISLVSSFGSLKNAVNADPEQVSTIGGWGEKKVNKWCSVVQEPFRVERAARRGLEHADSSAMEEAVPLSTVPLREMPRVVAAKSQAASRAVTRENTQTSDKPAQHHIWDPDADDDDEEEAMMAAAIAESVKTAAKEQSQAEEPTMEPTAPVETAAATKKPTDDTLNDGVAAALARLRQGG